MPICAGNSSDMVLASRIVSSVELHTSYNQYKYRMETIFHPPFSGSGYFRAAWDDHLKLYITPLDESGAAAGPTVTLYDTGYNG
jgi:hypothetical protein